MNSKSWDSWVEFYEGKGYTCYAPSYAYHDGEPAHLRKTINPKLGFLTLQEVIDSLSAFIDKLPEKPILIGHSMGGLIIQKLIELNKGVAGICIATAPPKGITSFKWSFLRANFPTINPLKKNSVCLPNLKWFHYSFCNTMTKEETELAYTKYLVPESRNIPRSSTKKDGEIDFNKPHNPILIIAGEKDNIIPSSLNKKNYNAYKDKNSKIDFKKFSGRSHFICNQDNWREVATYINNWIIKL